MSIKDSFSAFQYNTTVKLRYCTYSSYVCFSAFQYNTTVKLDEVAEELIASFSAFQYNTTVKPLGQVCRLEYVSVPFNITLL